MSALKWLLLVATALSELSSVAYAYMPDCKIASMDKSPVIFFESKRFSRTMGNFKNYSSITRTMRCSETIGNANNYENSDRPVLGIFGKIIWIGHRRSYSMRSLMAPVRRYHIHYPIARDQANRRGSHPFCLFQRIKCLIESRVQTN